ncbi:GGDEF domain-containing protein [Oscillospiraceae bacterium CM]|nr:GGDEF domain-containing protein [Oscillospiraceae bacterium CM]
MSFTTNLILNFYSLAVLVIIYFHAKMSTEKELLQQKLFMMMLQLTIVLLSLDVLSRFDGYPGTIYVVANYAGNFLVFLFAPVMPSLWLLYVYSQINDEKLKIRQWAAVLTGIIAVNAVLLVFSQFFGWYYTIDAGNIYQRGPLFWLPVTVTAILMVLSFIYVIANYKNIERKHLISLLLLPLLPLSGIVLQLIYYGTSLILNGAALSILIAFATIQNDRLNTDFLTGTYNRKGLEFYIRQKISASTENRTFSAILLDLDNFKYINDTYGHNTGDRVLAATADLLRSCLRSNDFVARYGGDEFYVILDLSDMEELEAIVGRLKRCFEQYNEPSCAPFKIGVSMGYAVYNYRSRLSAEAFQIHVDNLMYENKRANKSSMHQLELQLP